MQVICRILLQVIVNVTDTNDEVPAFLFTQYDVSLVENAPVNTTVATLQAFDRDLNAKVVFLSKALLTSRETC